MWADRIRGHRGLEPSDIVQRAIRAVTPGTGTGTGTSGIVRTDPEERERLRRWCGILAVAAAVFAVTNVSAAVAFRDASSLVMAAEMLAYAGLSLGGLALVARGREQAAVDVQVLTLLAIALTTVVTHPDLRPTTALAVLLAGIVALLFADRRSLPRLLVLTWAAGVVATLLALLPQAPIVRPAAFETLLSVSSVSAVTALILWLLWQSRGRAQALLRDVVRHEHRIQLMVDSAIDANIVIGGDGMIRSWNPRAEEVLGWSAAAAVGANLAELTVPQSELPAFVDAFQQAIKPYDPAQPVRLRREAMARHRDGHEVPVEISISRFDSDGELLISASVRDLSQQRVAEEHLDREIRERGAVARSVAQIRPGATAEQTAASICRTVCESLNLHVAAIYHLIGPNQATALGLRAPRSSPISRSRPLPPARAALLIRRARNGPWIERWEAREEDGAYGRRWSELGLRAVAYVPFKGANGLFGLLIAATTAPSETADDMTRRLPSLLEFAVLAGALLGPQLTGRRDRQAKAERIRRVLERQAFHAVFQPIVGLETGATVGYEALTRFDDLVRPDLRLAEAEAVGQGLELEAAMMVAALQAIWQLPEGPWISLNASPRLVLDGGRLRDILHDVPRRLVIEITEQSQIAEYAAVREAIANIGKHVRLAVDDAGAGFASLRHIIELRPDLVKLDVGLIQGIHDDSARQALVAGMVHFAQRAGCELIAEGIEDESDLRTLRGLGIRLGQGFLLGRPALPASFAEPGPSLPPPAKRVGVWHWPAVEVTEPQVVSLKN